VALILNRCIKRIYNFLTGAVSTTGIGEALLRSTAAHQIALAMGKGETPDQVT
jgi:isoaspartyl peptidase/L-asparaginase-like protein (Ntn-hydrolase superfamily)